MPVFVALLRGINVGKAKRIAMAELRALLGELGYTEVATLLNSGNAVFHASGGTSASLAAEISAAIASRLHIDVPVIVKSATELNRIISENPLARNAPDHSRLLVAFVQDTTALSEISAIERLVLPPEEFVDGKHAAYLHCVSGILASKAGEALLGMPGRAATTRNWATVIKLQALVTKPGA
jgi:uncharacterized protein (DUF1697 family)